MNIRSTFTIIAALFTLIHSPARASEAFQRANAEGLWEFNGSTSPEVLRFTRVVPRSGGSLDRLFFRAFNLGFLKVDDADPDHLLAKFGPVRYDLFRSSLPMSTPVIGE